MIAKIIKRCAVTIVVTIGFVLPAHATTIDFSGTLIPNFGVPTFSQGSTLSGSVEFDETASGTSGADFFSVQTFGTVSSLSLTVTDGVSGAVTTLTPFFSNAQILLSQNTNFGTTGLQDQIRINNSNFTLRFLAAIGTLTDISSLAVIDQPLIDAFLANPGGFGSRPETGAYAQFNGNTFAITSATVTTSAVPLPASAFLLLAGVGGLTLMRRKKS